MTIAAPDEIIRRLFEARAAGQVHRIVALMHPDVVVTTFTEDRTLHGIKAVLEHLRAQTASHREEVEAHRMVADGDVVHVSGRVRVLDGARIADSPAAWRFVVRDGRVARIDPVHAASYAVAS